MSIHKHLLSNVLESGTHNQNQEQRRSVFPTFFILQIYIFLEINILRNKDRFWADIVYVQEFFLAKSLQKTYFHVHEKLQRNPSVGSCIKIFIFRPYEFDYLGFLTNARRGAMRSKTQWVIYRDLD